MTFFERIQLADEIVLRSISEYLHDNWLDTIALFISKTADGGLIWIILGLFLLIFKSSRRQGALMLCSLTFSYLINDWIAKPLIDRPRPYETMPDLEIIGQPPHGNSMPSGHTASSFGAAFMLKLSGSPIGNPALIYAFLIGCSRCYLLVHYPSDVLAGAIMGILVSSITWLIYSRLASSRR